MSILITFTIITTNVEYNRGSAIKMTKRATPTVKPTAKKITTVI